MLALSLCSSSRSAKGFSFFPLKEDYQVDNVEKEERRRKCWLKYGQKFGDVEQIAFCRVPFLLRCINA